MNKPTLGIVLFIICLVVYGGMALMGQFQASEQKARGESARIIEQGQVRTLFRFYVFFDYLTGRGPSMYEGRNNEMLQQLALTLAEIIEGNPQRMEFRFALAVCQRELGNLEEAEETIDSAPPGVLRERPFERLRSLVLDETPNLALLERPAVIQGIRDNPAHYVWLASIYQRAGEDEKAHSVLAKGFKAGAPFVLGYTLVFGVWGLLSLVGAVFALVIFLRRKSAAKSSPPPVAVEPQANQAQAQTGGEDETQHQESGSAKNRISLALASEGAILWPIFQIPFIGLVLVLSQFDGGQGVGILASMAAFFFAALGVILWLRLRTTPPVSIGWKIQPLGRHIQVALALFILSPISIFIAWLVDTLFGLEPFEPSVMEIVRAQSVPMRILILISACTLIPVAEETIFRGLLFRGISARWGAVAGIIISSAIFAAMHGDLVAGLPIFVFALGLAWSVKYTGSLLPAGIAHGLFNLFPMLMLNLTTL